ncbi:MAG: molybdopterin oxidoreductase, rane subunit [Nonomuraea muscovyensis]|nr:molybdopterin oxidoreductase, rane subunit [Nonomuraea muscovyensis]
MTGSDLPWGPLLAAYVVLVGLASGLTLVTWWLNRPGGSAAPSIDRYGAWGAMAVLVVISVVLVVDLGRPERFYLVITRFENPASPIAMGAKLIAVKMFLLAVVIYALERRSPARANRVSVVLVRTVVLTSFALAVYPAALLARSWGSPLANSSGSALIFVITALLMGAAAVLIALSVVRVRSEDLNGFLHRTREALLVLLCAFGISLAFEVLSLAGRPSDRLLLSQLLTGGFAVVFWGVVVTAGIAVPAVGLLVFPGKRAALVASAVAVLTGAATARYLLFAVGH